MVRTSREAPKRRFDSCCKGPMYDSKRLGCYFESFQTLLVMHPSGEKKVKTDTLPNTCICMYK